MSDLMKAKIIQHFDINGTETGPVTKKGHLYKQLLFYNLQV